MIIIESFHPFFHAKFVKSLENVLHTKDLDNLKVWMKAESLSYL